LLGNHGAFVTSADAIQPRARVPLVALLAASGVSLTGNAITALAVPWFVLQTTGSAAKTGIVAFVSFLPAVLSGLLGGALIDRLGFRRTSIAADVASGATVALIPTLHYTVGIEFWQLLALVFAGALLDAPGQTAREALVPDVAMLAGTPLERAASATDAVSRGGRMLGAPLAGVLIALTSPAGVLYVDAGTFAVSALFTWAAVPAAARPVRDRASRYVAELREGFGFVWRDPLIRAIVAMVMVTNMLDVALASVVLPVYADRVLGGPVELGLVNGVFGAGALVGTVLFGAVGHRLPRFWAFTIAFALVGWPRYFVLAAEPGLAAVLVAMALTGLAVGPVNPILSAVQYERIPVELRGRVLGAVTAGVFAAMPLGGLLGGWLVEGIGLTPTLVALGTVYLAATLLPLVDRGWRELDRKRV
jgi:MFS family permease